MKTKIIFVDDEPRILDGLRRMLYSMRNIWQIAYAKSGDEALQCLEKDRYDVIVSDVRMPGMDGIELLTRVKESYPYMIRIVLSGHSDNEFVLKSTKVAHQYLSKPCTALTIKHTIQRACDLKEVLENTKIREIVSRMDTLPSLSDSYYSIIREFESTEPSVQKIAEIVGRDLAMSTKILQIVNSAFFGMPRHIENPAQAVHLLGLEMVRSLVLYVQIFNLVKEDEIHGFSLTGLWNHSLRVQDYTKIICQTENMNKRMMDHAVIAGLLHDIGILILVTSCYDDYREIIKIYRETHRPLYQVENEILHVNHASVGAYLLGIWGLPGETIEAVAYHHQPAVSEQAELNHISAVYASNAIDMFLNTKSANKQEAEFPFTNLYPEQFKDRLSLWTNKCRSQFNNKQE